MYNTCVVVNSGGKQLAWYRKRKVLRNIGCGTEECVIDLPFGRIVVLICHDIEHQDVLDQVGASPRQNPGRSVIVHNYHVSSRGMMSQEENNATWLS